MATLYHNLSGELIKEILSVGDGVSVNTVSIANTHATDSTYVDVYIGTISKKGVAATTYYLTKGYLLYKGETLILNPRFINSNNGLGLFVKLTGVTSTTPTADVIISK